MTQVSGSNAVVALYDETTWGTTPPAGSGRRAYVSALSLQPNQDLVRSDIITSGRGMERPTRGNLAPGGSIRTEVAPENVGFWLRHLFGTPATTGTEAPFTHVFTPTELPVGFSVEKDWTAEIASKVERFTGCRINSATFSFPQSGFVTLDLDVMGKSHVIAAAVIDDTPSDPGHRGFGAYEATVKLDGSTICTLTSGSLVIANALSGDLYTLCSGGERYSLAEGRCMVSGTMELVFEDFDLIEAAAAGTAISLEFILSRGTGLGAVDNESLSLLVTDADIARASPPIETEAGIVVSYSFEAFADGADLGIQATLKNAVAAADL